MLAAQCLRATLGAQTTAPRHSDGRRSKELMNIEIAPVSRKKRRPVPAFSAAAVFVITRGLMSGDRHDDRSRVTACLAPGVLVARDRIPEQWKRSRCSGFNQLAARRSCCSLASTRPDGSYRHGSSFGRLSGESRLDSAPSTTSDRIEVIRGLGGATWGAENAANGVGSPSSRNRRSTPRALPSRSALGPRMGRASRAMAGSSGRASHRLFARAGHNQSQTATGSPAQDDWQSQNHGFRIDWDHASDAMMVQGGDVRQPPRPLSRTGRATPAVKPLWSDRKPRRSITCRLLDARRRDNGYPQVQSFFNAHHNDDSVNPRCDPGGRRRPISIRARDPSRSGGRRRLSLLDEHVDGGIAFSITPNAETVTETTV